MYEDQSSGAASEEESHQSRRGANRRQYVKVVNTLEPSQASVSGFTRKTKVRSAFNSAISFSKTNDRRDKSEVAFDAAALGKSPVDLSRAELSTTKGGRMLSKKQSGFALTIKSKTTRTTSQKRI